MTAERKPVKMVARWLARVDGVSEMIKLAMLGLTGISTGLVTLKQYGHGQYAWHLVSFVLIGTLIFTYLYTEGGVWNQKARDKRDLSSNFAGPDTRIKSEFIVRGILAGQKGEEISQEELDAIKKELDKTFLEHRKGINIENKIKNND